MKEEVRSTLLPLTKVHVLCDYQIDLMVVTTPAVHSSWYTFISRYIYSVHQSRGFSKTHFVEEAEFIE